ncbi:MAG TPA: SRPBCC domain-containing protein [Acidimicrobiales bacterium]
MPVLTGFDVVDAEWEIELHVVVACPPEGVWRALTDNAAIRQWWAPGVVLDPEVGGAFVEPWVDPSGRRLVTSGVVLEAVPASRLSLTWADHGWPFTTFVEVRLAPHPEGTLVELRHTGWEQWGEADRRNLLRSHAEGWEHHLAALTAYCEERA